MARKRGHAVDREERWDAELQPEPAIYEMACETPFESDTEDFYQDGDGTPCRSYNHNGCARGRLCQQKHSPDSMSIRDGLYVYPHLLARYF